MKKNISKGLFVSFASITLLLSGCVNPNNTGTQAGAATGAVAGAVIGANTNGHHNGRRMAIGAVVGAIAGGGAGQVIKGEDAPQTGGWQ